MELIKCNSTNISNIWNRSTIHRRISIEKKSSNSGEGIMATLTVTVTPTPTSAYVNQSVSIRVTISPYSGPNPAHYVINYGDDSQETKDVAQNNWTFTHTYTTSGTMPISVNVTDLNNGNTGSGSSSVQIAGTLTVTLSADKTSGKVPLAITFTFSITGGVTPITTTLDPGDGSTPYSNSTSPKTHTYSKVGSFTVTLTVTDALGATAVLRMW